jgi:hypothetical protein
VPWLRFYTVTFPICVNTVTWLCGLYYTAFGGLECGDVFFVVNNIPWLPAWIRWRNFRREYCPVILACKLLRDFTREYSDVTLRAWLYCVWIAGLNTMTRLWSWIIYRDCWLGYVDVILGVNTVPWFWLVNCYVTSRVNIVTWLCELDYTVFGLRDW